MPNEVLSQLLRPPFPQVLMISAAMLCITCLLLWVFRVKDPRVRSLYYGLVLLAPLATYLVFTPSVWEMRPQFSSDIIMVNGLSFVKIQEELFVNYTGLLCVVGLVFGAVTLALSYFFGVEIIRRIQGVMVVTRDEEPALYRLVSRVCARLGVEIPIIGLTESLQPNAFTVGYGRKTMVVFSSGLIQTLAPSELEAIAAHEIAHIKNGDFHLMAITSSLKVASFFNPLSYLTASMLAREREYLADAVGSRATRKKDLLRRALVKIASTSTGRDGNALANLTSGLFVYSQIGSLRATFASHPSLDRRVSRIGSRGGSFKVEKYKAAAVGIVLLGSMLLLSAYIMQPMFLVGEISRGLYAVFGVDLIGAHGLPGYGFRAFTARQAGPQPPPPIHVLFIMGPRPVAVFPPA